MNAMSNGNNKSQRRRPPVGREHVHRQERQNGAVGNPHRNYERYVALAREAATAGDAVQTENWYQHAEHYFRMMREQAS